MKEKHLKEKEKRLTVLLIIRIILSIIILSCMVYIFLWFQENQKNAKILSQVTDESVVGTTYVEVPVENPTEENQQEETIKIPVYELNFEKLLSINNSTMGWITVPNTSINYPVVKATNNDFYLNHSFDKSQNTAGWIFADYRNSFDGNDKNIIIYGHNRMDSSMFATLKNTQKANWYNNPDNKYISFSTPDTNHVYEVFSVYTIKMEGYYLTTVFNNDAEYLDFLNTLKNRSIHDFGVNLTAEDNILTLSTCDATGKSRVILHAKQIL